MELLPPDPSVRWETFSIWGSGRDARKFYMTLSVILSPRHDSLYLFPLLPQRCPCVLHIFSYFLQSHLLTMFDAFPATSFSSLPSSIDSHLPFFYSNSQPSSQERVSAFYDVDPNKVGKPYVNCWTSKSVPVLHLRDIRPPFVICVTSDRYMEADDAIAKLPYREGIDYWRFM